MRSQTFALVLSTFLIGGCSAGTTAPSDESSGSSTQHKFLVIGAETGLPTEFDARVTSLGGDVLSRYDDAAIAVVSGAGRAFYEELARDGSVDIIPDFPIGVPLKPQSLPTNVPPLEPFEDDFYYNFQWAHTAMNTPGAWATGATGSGARVAVLDTGISPYHPDVAPNLNASLSVSFVPGESPFADPVEAPSHGTGVASVIAAADNGIGLIGVAPDAEIVAVKVVSDVTGVGYYSWMLAGLEHAADIGADVANVSVGALLPKEGFVFDFGTPDDPSDDITFTKKDIRHIVKATNRAFKKAKKRGVLVVTSAGNDSVNGDIIEDDVIWPGTSPHGIAVSGTGPQGWIFNPFTDLDKPAYYTNTGEFVDFAAPGGNLDFGLVASGQICNGLPCFAFDMIPIATTFAYSADLGTSYSAAHVSGVAALVVSAAKANGGKKKHKGLTPNDIINALKHGADDLGAPGDDPVYGHGRVNASKAVAEVQ